MTRTEAAAATERSLATTRDDEALRADADVEIAALKPHRSRRKGLKPAVQLIEQQRRMFGPEISVTVWSRRG